MKKNRTMIVAFLLPAVISYLIIFVYPTLRTALMSLYEVETVTDSFTSWNFVGLANYQSLLGSELFRMAMSNMFKIWLYGGIITFSIGLLFAVMLTSGVKGKSFYRAVIYLPNIISAVAMGTMWMQYVFSSRYGLFKQVFSFLGIDYLANFQWTAPNHIFISLLIAYCFGSVGYFMLIFMSAIERIPKDYYESAMLLGATRFQQFTKITLPLIRDVFRTNIVLWTISTAAFFVWSQVFSPIVMEKGTVTPMVYMFHNVFGNSMMTIKTNVGAGAAVGVLLTVIVVLMFVITSIVFKDEKIEF